MRVLSVSQSIVPNRALCITKRSTRGDGEFWSPSFSALRKSKLMGLPLACACMFKAPLEKFKNEKQLEAWVEDKVQDLEHNSRAFSAVYSEELVQWRDFLKNEPTYKTNPFEMLIMLSSFENKAKKWGDFPSVEPVVIKSTFEEIDEELKKDRKFTFNFLTLYSEKLKKYTLNKSDYNEVENGTGWMLVPSKMHDRQGFANNSKNLRNLSYKTWCTHKGAFAESILEDGDFHIYFENNKPRVGIRIYNGYITEIQGVRNNYNIPIEYVDVVEQRIKDKSLVVPERMMYKINNAKKAKIKAETIKQDLATAIKENDVKKILNHLGISCKEETNWQHFCRKIKGLLNGENVDERLFVVSSYSQPVDISFAELGINEDDLLKKIVKIEYDANFMTSDATNLGALLEIGGRAFFMNSKIKDFGRLKKVSGIDIRETQQLFYSPMHEMQIGKYKIPPNTYLPNFAAPNTVITSH